MEQEIILKKTGVQIIRQRFKEMPVPLGFLTNPVHKGSFVRVRDELIDEIALRTDGYHLEPIFSIYYRPAPFAAFRADGESLQRFARESGTTDLEWNCEIPKEGGPYYYQPEHFEKVWKNVVSVLEQYVLPKMEEMTAAQFLSLLVKRYPYDREFFHPDQIISFTALGHLCRPEAAVYGIGMWLLGKYEEGVPYLTFAQYGYRRWLTDGLVKPDHSHFYQAHVRISELLDELVGFWQRQEENWERDALARIGETANHWSEYML